MKIDITPEDVKLLERVAENCEGDVRLLHEKHCPHRVVLSDPCYCRTDQRDLAALRSLIARLKPAEPRGPFRLRAVGTLTDASKDPKP